MGKRWRNDDRLAAFEVRDAVESDDVAFEIDGVKVTDFVLPGYFSADHASGRYDFGGHLSAPCSALTPGGYMSVEADGEYQDETVCWVAIARLTADGATSPFAQASLNDRLPHSCLPLVRGGRGFGLACAIVVMEGEAITYASKRPTSGPVTRVLAASLPDFLRNRMHDEARMAVPAAAVTDLPDQTYEWARITKSRPLLNHLWFRYSSNML